MKFPTRTLITLALLPLLYLSGVRFVSQCLISTDKSTIFKTRFDEVLSTPQAFALNGTCTPSLPASRFPLPAILAFDPFNPDYRYLLARECLSEGKFNRAEDISLVSTKLSVLDPKSWLLLGWAEGLKNRTEQGYTAFNRAMMLDPKRPESFAQQGLYLHQVWLNAAPEGKALYRTLALMSLRSALEMDGSLYHNPDVNTAVASLYYSLGQPGYSIGVLTKVPDNTSMNLPLVIQRAALFFELGEGVKAISLWKTQFNPKTLSPRQRAFAESEIRRYQVPELAYFLAQIHVFEGKYDQALKELSDLVAKKGNSAEYKVALAAAYEHTGSTKEASRLYEEALNLSPTNQEAKKKVMEYYGRRNR